MSVEQEIRAAEMHVVFRTPLGLLTSAVIGAVSVGVLAPALPPLPLLAWASALALCLAARLLLWWAYRANGQTASATGPWLGWFSLGTGATGVLWGALAVVILISDDPVHHAFVVMVLAGMAAGAVAALAPCLPALYAFVAPIGLQLTVALVLHGGRAYLAIGGMVVVFLVSGGMIARGLTRSFVSIVRLSSEKARLADELGAARDAAEEASRTKSQILMNVTHELRTPLNAIIGLSELIGDTMREPVGERIREYTRDILASAHHLLGLINDVLDFGKIEASRMELREEKVEVAGVVAACLRLVAQRAKQGGVHITTGPISDLLVIWADRMRLKQIVLNLLSNAIKFTPAGGKVTIAAAYAADGGVTIGITDTGVGMRPDEIPIALEPFRQIEQGLNRRYEGTGLGLPLTKQLVELHGGALTIESEPGKGTTVRVSIPRSRVFRAAA